MIKLRMLLGSMLSIFCLTVFAQKQSYVIQVADNVSKNQNLEGADKVFFLASKRHGMNAGNVYSIGSHPIKPGHSIKYYVSKQHDGYVNTFKLVRYSDIYFLSGNGREQQKTLVCKYYKNLPTSYGWYNILTTTVRVSFNQSFPQYDLGTQNNPISNDASKEINHNTVNNWTCVIQ